ncbi:hypothetical protein Pmar_PMAR019081 [Perkinsus marinus ATCC 50983]|uniref:Uncharacterized protein n=1 Tax=Perkinsus marinus (strain ATCC 50983 / TXsc) TaxID=423536 RepID=C5KTT7_PERM5|nr:hypothetical protein Pmar_PMAR019081 [Perkinsus marinus ATCC 50983]EER11979.1 hypothetical protein Pmar_PMAR019081 [Perkinsus marinus ATCC 50983]|eukprot:XP_002780184.1 hypothetical protein Pmar_PMAR019081 [Perkinsus marinus ATCC 50983]
MESRLFPHSGVEKENLVVVDPELLTSSRERIRSVLVEDLREAHKLVDAYSVHVGPISELLAPCIAADDLDASRDFVSQCSQYVDAVGQVCPGGIRTQLFFVDTSTVVRKFAAAIRKVSQDFLVSTAEQLDETAQEIGYIYRGLEQYFNVPEDDYEAEKLLRAVENIAERTLDPLEENIAELVDVLNFLDHSQFLVSLDLRVEIYHLLSTAPDVRADLRQLCEDLKSREGQQSEGIDPDD